MHRQANHYADNQPSIVREGRRVGSLPMRKEKQHLIADHLGWLSEPGTTIETMMAERGQEVQRMLDEGEDILHVD